MRATVHTAAHSVYSSRDTLVSSSLIFWSWKYEPFGTKGLPKARQFKKPRLGVLTRSAAGRSLNNLSQDFEIEPASLEHDREI